MARTSSLPRSAKVSITDVSPVIRSRVSCPGRAQSRMRHWTRWKGHLPANDLIPHEGAHQVIVNARTGLHKGVTKTLLSKSHEASTVGHATFGYRLHDHALAQFCGRRRYSSNIPSAPDALYERMSPFTRELPGREIHTNAVERFLHHLYARLTFDVATSGPLERVLDISADGHNIPLDLVAVMTTDFDFHSLLVVRERGVGVVMYRHHLLGFKRLHGTRERTPTLAGKGSYAPVECCLIRLLARRNCPNQLLVWDTSVKMQ